MSNIDRIIGDLPDDLTDINITYYDGATINNYYFGTTSPRQEPLPGQDDDLPTSIPLTTHINATINPNNLSDLNDIINFADALSNTLDGGLINNSRVSISQLIANTGTILYKCLENGEEKCHICNEPYNDDDICRQNNVCKHYFHQMCIDNWYSGNNKCPICQQTFN
tara:strand:+ start:548 stop:1048 length:501 start_codon:yes stop_codon:yes gene_type:complete